MTPKNKIIAAILAAGFALVVALAALAVQLHRHNYNLQGGEGAQYLIRTDRLTGTSCYVPIGSVGDQVASQVLVVDRCEDQYPH